VKHALKRPRLAIRDLRDRFHKMNTRWRIRRKKPIGHGGPQKKEQREVIQKTESGGGGAAKGDKAVHLYTFMQAKSEITLS